MIISEITLHQYMHNLQANLQINLQKNNITKARMFIDYAKRPPRELSGSSSNN